jgi:hypothetical protein
VSNLLNLAVTMNRVPTDRITFVTMPWEPDPADTNRVVAWQPEADTMFANLAADTPYSTGSAGASTSTATATGTSSPAAPATSRPPTTNPESVVKAQVRVQVLNAGGGSGRASTVRGALISSGFSLATVGGNTAPTSATKVYYPPTRADSAAAVADALGLPASALTQSNTYAEVTVAIGGDWTSGTTYPAGATSSGGKTATTAATAPEDSSPFNASTTTGCVQVSPEDIVR